VDLDAYIRHAVIGRFVVDPIADAGDHGWAPEATFVDAGIEAPEERLPAASLASCSSVSASAIRCRRPTVHRRRCFAVAAELLEHGVAQAARFDEGDFVPDHRHFVVVRVL